ncbi:MAG: peptidyl-prolyl cis-trans isomerase [Agathobacter sp.]|nr:peptidyl-prolyl cis-trans isomerase [Agathobacter sp.]
MKKRIGVLILTVSLLAGILSGCTIGNTEYVLDKNNVGRNDVFSINGVDCTKEEVRLYLCNYQNIYGHEYGIDLWQHDFGEIPQEETLEYYVKEVTLAELANIFCMNQLAEEKEITLTEEEQKLVSQAADEYYESLSRDEIRFMGIDKGELKGFYEKYAIAQKLYNTLTQGVNEEVSDDEARVMLVQQIFVKNEADAQTIKQQLSEGKNFETLATNYNEADAIQIHLARGTYPEEVDNIVFNMDNDELSGMIETEEGYYFFYCLDKFVEDMTEANKENIIIQRRKEQFDDAFNEFILNSDFDLNERVWESIKVDTSGIITTDSYFEVYDKYFSE